MTSRATSSVVSIVLLVAVTVVTASLVGTMALGGTSALVVEPPESRPPTVSMTASADASTNSVTLTHRGGDPLALNDTTVRIVVDSTPLKHQPPVPFVGAHGFNGTPSGPFNAESDDTWHVGEKASVRIADNNSPQLSPGDQVTVELYTEDYKILTVTAAA